MKTKRQLELGIEAEGAECREADNKASPESLAAETTCSDKARLETLAADIAREVEACEPTHQQEVLALILHHGRTLFRAGEMRQFFGGSKDLFHECRDAGWLIPVVRGSRMTEYSLPNIAQCIRRLRKEGRPLHAATAKGGTLES